VFILFCVVHNSATISVIDKNSAVLYRIKLFGRHIHSNNSEIIYIDLYVTLLCLSIQTSSKKDFPQQYAVALIMDALLEHLIHGSCVSEQKPDLNIVSEQQELRRDSVKSVFG